MPVDLVQIVIIGMVVLAFIIVGLGITRLLLSRRGPPVDRVAELQKKNLATKETYKNRA